MIDLELKDWKDVEDKCTELIREHMIGIKVNEEILKLCHIEIMKREEDSSIK